jgi:hypothetical protein
MSALSGQLFFVSLDFVHGRAPQILCTVCTRIPGFCARIAHDCLNVGRGWPEFAHGLRADACIQLVGGVLSKQVFLALRAIVFVLFA